MGGGGTTDEESRQREVPLDFAAFLLLALILFAWLSFSRALFNDGDTSWHLAAGRLIVDSRSVPDADPFSFTFAGRPWMAHEWLAEAVMAVVFRAGSWGGLALLFAAAVSALLLIVGLELRRRLPARHAIMALAIIFIVLTPSILARPHVLAWPILAGWTIILLRAREAGRAPPPQAALLMLVWANLHGSFVFGLLLVGLFALEALAQGPNRRSIALQWGGFGLLSLLLSLVTPYGIHGLLFPLQVSGMESLPLIMEWRATDPSKDWLFVVLLAATAILLVYRRIHVPPFRLILLALLVLLALLHIRHQPLLAIVGALVLAEPFAQAFQAKGRPVPSWSREASFVFGAFLLGAATVAMVRLSVPIEPKSSASNPVAAIEAVPRDLRNQPVLNSYGFGGPLIVRGIRPYIDGRADIYGDAFIFDHQALMNGNAAAFRQAVDRWHIRWTILAPDAPLVRLLDRTPGWRRIYSDDWAVVHAASDVAGRRDH